MTKTFKQIREIDVPKGHEYGPSSRKRPAGKAGYTSSDSARTTHLKTVKKWSKKKRFCMIIALIKEDISGAAILH